MPSRRAQIPRMAFRAVWPRDDAHPRNPVVLPWLAPIELVEPSCPTGSRSTSSAMPSSEWENRQLSISPRSLTVRCWKDRHSPRREGCCTRRSRYSGYQRHKAEHDRLAGLRALRRQSLAHHTSELDNQLAACLVRNAPGRKDVPTGAASAGPVSREYRARRRPDILKLEIGHSRP